MANLLRDTGSGLLLILQICCAIYSLTDFEDDLPFPCDILVTNF